MHAQSWIGTTKGIPCGCHWKRNGTDRSVMGCLCLSGRPTAGVILAISVVVVIIGGIGGAGASGGRARIVTIEIIKLA